MYKYKVLSKGYIGDTICKPGHNDPVILNDKLDPCPSWLALIPQDGDPIDVVDATEGARNLASNNDVDLTKVQGSGKNGRIEKRDVQVYLKGHTPESSVFIKREQEDIDAEEAEQKADKEQASSPEVI